jgi:Protein of unknown function (DUF2934)
LKAEKTVMAKRPTSQPKSLDPAEAPRPKAKRARKTAPPPVPAPVNAAPPESIAAAAAELIDVAPAESLGRPVVEPTLDDIRRRAYERYLERGGKHGQHFDDWLEAERELRARK